MPLHWFNGVMTDSNWVADIDAFRALDAPASTPLNIVYVFPLSGTANTSAQEYIAQKKFTSDGNTYYNQNHTDYTARNALWIYNEMQGINQTYDCEDYCDVSSMPMSGSSTICTSETYSINGLPPGSSVTWSSSPLNIISLAPAGNTVLATKIINGQVTLMATVSSSCGN